MVNGGVDVRPKRNNEQLELGLVSEKVKGIATYYNSLKDRIG